jgi:hypothetical protein
MPVQTIYNVYSPTPLTYPILLFLPFPIVVLSSWLHLVSQIEGALLAIAGISPNRQNPHYLKIARITNWVVLLWAALQFIGQYIMLGICTGEIIRVFNAAYAINALLEEWGAAWTEGSPLPLRQLLLLQPLMDQASLHFARFGSTLLAYSSILFAHVYLAFLIVFPVTYIQVKEIRRQLADLRTVRRNTETPDKTRNPFRRLARALFYTSEGEVASISSTSSTARLLLLESLCLNMFVCFDLEALG